MRHAQYHRSPSPLALFAFAMLVFWLFGFKLFFFIPLLFIFGGFRMMGMCDMSHYDRDWTSEKPKRKSKPKYDYDMDDDRDDITYV